MIGLGAQQQLAALYAKWGEQVELQHKIVLHLMLQSSRWIALIVLLTLLVGWGLQSVCWTGCRRTGGRSRRCGRFWTWRRSWWACCWCCW